MDVTKFVINGNDVFVKDTQARDSITTLSDNVTTAQNTADRAEGKADDAQTVADRAEGKADDALANSLLFVAKNNYTIKSDTAHADVLEISTTSATDVSNMPHLIHQVGSGTPLTNMPANVSGGFLGIREVYYFDASNIAVKMTRITEPFDTYMNRWNGSTWKGWYKHNYDIVS